MLSSNNLTRPTSRSTILVGLLCVAIYCCPLQLAEACPFIQKKIDQQQQQWQSKGATTTEDGCTSEDKHLVLRHNQQRRTQAGCDGTFCYGSLVPTLPPLVLDWATLVAIAEPTEQQDVGYMEDSQSRANELDGFPLNNGNGGSIAAAGYTYLGQLLSHDLNSDESSTLGQPVDPATIPNVNNPSVDLDTIYNFDGCSPALTNRRTKFAMNGRDYRRFPSGFARICDSRNDNNRILSQITVAWMNLHNKFVDDEGFNFAQARDATIKEWQAVVLTDLLPNILDEEILSAVAGGDRVLYVGDAKDSQTMPAEFSTAAYRLMHSRARASYRLNNDTIFRLFDVGGDEPNLIGGSPLPEEMVIDWGFFFGDRANGVEVARILDMLYVQPMMRLPFNEAGNPSGTETVVECDSSDEPSCPIAVDEPEVCPANGDPCAVRANLALLDMVRGQTHSLPGGIAYAEHVQTLVPSLDVLDIADMEGNVFGLPEELGAGTTDVPLLLYLAHESILDHDGELLGALGSRIVAEVIYGLVETTTPSILEGSDFVSLITGESNVSMFDVLDHIGWR